MIRLGGSDCEQLVAGVLAQPVNAVSSLAFVAAGVSVLVVGKGASGWLRRYLAVYAVTLIGVGVGSFAYHGPQPSWAGVAHDGSIVLALACAVPLVATAARRGGRIAVVGGLVAAGLAAYVAGRTGSPLCDPHSWAQPHAAWHVLAAAAALGLAWPGRASGTAGQA